MSKVFVIDTNKQPLNPLHPGRARLLLKQGKAAVYRRYPFTLILKRAVEQPHLEPLRVKIDPGSKTTGIALVNDGSSEVVWAAELIHRGEQIRRDMDKRRAVRKGNQDIHEFLKEQPERLARILAQAKTPLRDAAAVNATRWAWYERLEAFGLPVECGSGGLTKFNRTTRDLPKTHWCDAACVGRSTPESLFIENVVPLYVTATGHGSRQMCRMDEYGFPRTKPKGARRVKGFQKGDLVRAVVTSGTKQGTYVGKVAVRTRGVFNIKTVQGTVTDIHYRFCANDTEFGLQAGIFTGSISVAMQAARGLHVGGVMINDTSFYRAGQMPYGGVKHSGMGREGPHYAIEEMTELRLVVLNPQG